MRSAPTRRPERFQFCSMEENRRTSEKERGSSILVEDDEELLGREVDNCMQRGGSRQLHVICGVPQGSVLGPTSAMHKLAGVRKLESERVVQD